LIVWRIIGVEIGDIVVEAGNLIIVIAICVWIIRLGRRRGWWGRIVVEQRPVRIGLVRI
jgi:hypothetical protein